VLDVFHLQPRQTLHFIEWLELNQLHSAQKADTLPLSYIATYEDVLPQLLHTLLRYKIQHT
jgi:hypothetical protein